jgi:hypothetical protein
MLQLVLPYAAPLCGVLGHNRVSFSRVLAKVFRSLTVPLAVHIRYREAPPQ